MTFILRSPAFAPNDPIPKKYTGDGDDCSPPLEWSGAPLATASFVLTVEDPDAPGGVFHHWALLNIPPDIVELHEGYPAAGPIREMRELLNGFGHEGYGGPLPPHGHGPHRYVFALRALSVDRVDPEPNEAPGLLGRRLAPVTLDTATLIGTYER